MRKLGTKTHFAKLTHILPLKKAWGCCYKGLFLLSPSPPSSVDCVELKLECITSTLHRGGRGEGRCLNLRSYCVSVPRVLTRVEVKKKRNNFPPPFFENVKKETFGYKFTNWCTLLARGALCTSFILSAVYNDCVSSSERASIASKCCVRITKCCGKDIEGHQSSSKSRGRAPRVRIPAADLVLVWE